MLRRGFKMAQKIMIVDDDRDFRAEFKDCLSEYDIVEASSAKEAITVLKRPNEIDLVILDVNMPGLKGTEVLSEIKEIAPEVRIVIMTGHSSESVVLEALRGRADEYIQKPFDVPEAKEIIERLLSSGRASVKDRDDKVSKVKAFVERNCFKRIGLDDAAKAVFLSPKYLSRIFKEKTGVGFNEYRLKLLMKRARELLTTTSGTVNEISYKLGYKNPESFIRQFKIVAGATPTDYRKGKKKKI